MNKQELYNSIRNYFTDKPVNKVALFGSFARNENTAGSDIDLLITTSHPVGLFTLGKYISDLEDITRHKIDIATEGSLTPAFFNEIKKDLKTIYAR